MNFDNFAFDGQIYNLQEYVVEHSLRRLTNHSHNKYVSNWLNNATDSERRKHVASQQTFVNGFFKVDQSGFFSYKLDNRRIRIIMQRKLGLDFFNTDVQCTKCQSMVRPNGDHAMTCITGKGRINRHDVIAKYIGSLCNYVGIKYKMEKRNMIPGTLKKPADILLYNFDDGKDLAIDVGISYILKESIPQNQYNTPLSSANQMYKEKIEIFEKIIKKKGNKNTETLPINFTHIPFVLEEFGGVHPEAKEIMQQFANIIAGRMELNQNFVLQKIMNKMSAILQAKNGFMILNHFPLIY